MNHTLFAEKVYRLCKKIPKGKVSTYKDIAEALGTKAYRAVGQALKNNPYAPDVPCHRIIASDGSLGGFKGKQTIASLKEKKRLLMHEGVTYKKGKIDKTYFFSLAKCKKN